MGSRWLKPSKDGKSLRFSPKFTILEDRSVPSTFYVDPTLAAADGSTVTFDTGTARQVNGLIFSNTEAYWSANKATVNTFADLKTAIAVSESNPGADTIVLASKTIPLDNSAVTFPISGTEFINSINITQDLTLLGGGSGSTVIAPTDDTEYDDGSGAVPDEFTSVLRVDGATAKLTASNLALNGTGKQIGAGVLVRGGSQASFTGVTVAGSQFTFGGSDRGSGIIVIESSKVDFVDGTISTYGRSGIAFIHSTGSVHDSSVIGNNLTAFIQNGIEVTGDTTGGSNVIICGNTISNNTGNVAGAFSSGILVAGDATGANPSSALIIGNTITANAGGLNLGVFPTPDTSVVTANYNNFIRNQVGIYTDVVTNKSDLTNNYFNSITGPFAAGNPGGTGDSISNGSKGNFTPFLKYITPTVCPTDFSTPAAAAANYLNIISTIGTVVSPVGSPTLTTNPGTFTFNINFAQPVTEFVLADILSTITTTGFGGTPTYTLTPASGTSGAYVLTATGLTGKGTISVSVPTQSAIDPTTGYLSAVSNTASITVANAAPTISPISDLSVLSTSKTAGPVNFTVGDDTDAAGTLGLTFTTSDGTVVPASSIVLGGTGANRTVSFINLPGGPGATTITLTVTDSAGLTSSSSFNVNVANIAPTVSAIASVPLATGTTSAGPFSFTIGDDTTPVGSLVVTATSSNGTVVPASSIVLGGSGANRTISFVNLPGVAGSSTITVQVKDAQGLTSDSSFSVTLTTPANAPPTLTGTIADQTLTLPSGSTGALAFTIGDDVTPASALSVSFASSNTTVVPLSSITLGGSGANRTITVANLPGQVGASAITLTVTDASGAITTKTFVVNVAAAVPGKVRLFAVGSDVGSLPNVQVFGSDGVARFNFMAFEANMTGGVRVATADVDGDGTDDIVVGAGTGGAGRVRVFSGKTQAVLFDIFAYDANFRGGAFVAAGDLDGDGKAEVVTGAGVGGGSHVRAFKLDGTVVANYFAFEPAFRGGVTVAVGDSNKDGVMEIVAGAGPGVGAGPRVQARQNNTVVADYFAFDTNKNQGVYVTAGTFGIAAALGTPSTSEVRLLSGGKFTTYETGFTGGVRLGKFDLGNDGVDEILTAPGIGGGSRIQAFSASGTQVLNTFAFDNLARSGYFIGG
jgi:FG-GAP repeat